MTTLPINMNVHIKHTDGHSARGLGLYATRHLSPGLKVFDEQAVHVCEDRESAMRSICEDWPYIQPELQVVLLKLFAGPSDTQRPSLAQANIDTGNVSETRLQNIARYNAVEGQGTGCFLSIAASAINHS